MSSALTSWPAGWPSPEVVFSLVAIAMAIAAVLIALAFRARTAGYGYREIRRALEEMAAGRLDREVDLAPGDPARDLALALDRLATSLRHRLAEAEGRADIREAVLVGLRDAMVLATDGDYDVILAGGAVREMLGEEPMALRGRHLGTLLAAESWEKLLPRLARKALREQGMRTTVDLLPSDGAPRPAMLTAGALHGGGLALLLVPETSASEVERRREEEQAQYRTLVEGMADGGLVVQDGRITYANPAVARMLGTSRDRLLRRSLRDLVGARHLLLVLERLARVVEGEEAPPTSLTLIDEGGMERPVDARLSRVVLEGRPGVALSLRDVAPERESLARARREEARLDAALEASSDALLMFEFPREKPANPRVALANRRCRDLFRLTGPALIGMTAQGVSARVARQFEDPSAFTTGFVALLRDPDAVGVEEMRMMRPSPRWIERFSAPVRDGSGRTVGRIFSFRDITHQKERERRLRQDAATVDRARRTLEKANADLARVNVDLERKGEELDKLNQELRRLDEMRSDLLSNVSHELQTPLVSIKGYTEMILAGRLGEINEEQRRGLEVALRNIDRLIGLIGNLLSLSRMEGESGELQPSDFPLVEVVDEVVRLQTDTLRARGIELVTRYLTDDVVVRADRDKVTQVFTNLVSNAIKFNRDGGRVEIVMRRGRRGFLVVDVVDTGVGIPESEQPRIFERYYRSSGGPQPGTGLGLSIVQEILRLHGCVISVESQPGRGSTFTFTLPLAGAMDVGTGTTGEAEPAAGSVREEPPSRSAPARGLFRLVRPRR